MFQDIAPRILRNEFNKNRNPRDHDYLVAYRDNRVLVYDDSELVFPTISEVRKLSDIYTARLIHLFDINDSGFFLSSVHPDETENLTYQDVAMLQKRQPLWLCFAGATAVHLARWYENNRFCGRCGRQMDHKEDERALHCPYCGMTDYPKINPVVIVGITDGERLLLTKYASSDYKNYSLVAGFSEIGETLEDTVRREVMEEVGLKVKNIRYYKSQPWAFSESILVGFFADVDGSAEPVIDTYELCEAVWFSREEIPKDDTPFSLTWDMIENFRADNLHGKLYVSSNLK